MWHVPGRCLLYLFFNASLTHGLWCTTSMNLLHVVTCSPTAVSLIVACSQVWSCAAIY